MNKIVTFSRGADFLHQRAMSNRRQGSMLDALDLMRGALEREPDNLTYQMDLAELYCEMGCHRQSIRILLSVLASNEPLSECLFGMCCNYVGMRDYSAAYSLMMWFLALDSASIERQEVAETLAMLVQRQFTEMGEGHKKRRAHHFEARGKALLRQGNAQAGAGMLRRAHGLELDDQPIAALLALALGDAGEREEALALMDQVLDTGGSSAQVHHTASTLYAALGEVDRAKAQLESLRLMDRDYDEQFLLLSAAEQLGADQLVLETASALLRVTPYDGYLLHRKAVALTNIGGEGAHGANRCWERIARIDPANSVAKYYASAAARGALTGVKLRYDGEVPVHERMARVQHVQGVLEHTEPQAAWDGSVRFRAMIGWMARSADGPMWRSALDTLLLIDRPDVALLLRECLLRPDIDRAQRQRITGYLSARGHRPPYIVPDNLGRLRDASVPRDGRWSYSPSQRRVLTAALRTRASGQGRHAPQIEATWREYLIEREHRPPLIHRPAAWSAALVAIRLKLTDDEQAVQLLAHMFGCSRRMIVRCARRIARGAQSPKEEQADETH